MSIKQTCMVLDGLLIAAKSGVIVYRNNLNENTPILRGVCAFLDSLFSMWWVHSKPVGTYIHKQSNRARRRHCAFCG